MMRQTFVLSFAKNSITFTVNSDPYKRRFERERTARKEFEHIVENRTRELFDTNHENYKQPWTTTHTNGDSSESALHATS